MLKVVSLPPKKQINWKVILFVNITPAFYALKMLKIFMRNGIMIKVFYSHSIALYL